MTINSPPPGEGGKKILVYDIHSKKFQIFIEQNLLEHRTQIHLSRIIRQILLNVFSVTLIQSLLHDLSTGVCPLAVPRLHIIIISQSLFHVDSTSDTARFKN